MTPDPDALDASRLPRATGWRFGYLLVQGVASVVLFVALGHVLPGPAFNAVAVAQGILVLCQAIGDFGLSQATTTALTARGTTEPERRTGLVAAAATAYWIGAGAALVLTVGAAALLPAETATATAVIAPASACTVLVAGADGILRSEGEFRRPFLLMSASRLGAFAGLGVAFFSDSPTLVAAGIAAGTVAGSLPAARLLASLAHGVARTDLRWFAVVTAPLGLSSLLVLAASRLDTLILGSVSTVREAAAFEATWRLFQLGQYAGGVLATSSAPFIASLVVGAEGIRARRLVLRILTIGLGVGLVVGPAMYLLRAPLGEIVFPADPERVASLLPLFALATPLGMLGQISNNALGALPRGRRFIPVAFGCGALVNLMILLVGVQSRGASAATEGAAIGMMVLYGMLTVRCLSLPPIAGRPRPGRQASA